ncbi:MAG: hypothetical protein NTX49_09235 [Chlamydiae bacterium]|nr:hypothetical protein [Chlamydiota bacterium]
MKITIAEPLRPFSHTPGSSCIIPFSGWKCRIFPSKIEGENLLDNSTFEVSLTITGPVKQFTVQQELQEGTLKVFGQAVEGYFRYSIRQKKEGLCLAFEKVPQGGLSLYFANATHKIDSPQVFILSDKKGLEVEPFLEKLSLGEHKAQDWSSMRKRADFSEIFPHWLRLGQIVPDKKIPLSSKGMLSLLQKCQDTVTGHARNEILSSFNNLFLAGFSSMLAPRLVDDEHQGILGSENTDPDSSALQLLSGGASLIRSLFFQEKEGVYHLLPCLPPEFHSGRMIGIRTELGDVIDIEWSKKLLKKVIIRVSSAKEISLGLQKEIDGFRMRKAVLTTGIFLKSDDKITCDAGDVIYLDKFQK